jgi:hypothetical protein
MLAMNRLAANPIGVSPRRFILLPEEAVATSGHGRRIRRYQLSGIARGVDRGHSAAGAGIPAAQADRDPAQAGPL